MSIQITMPALSPTMEEGNLAKWHVKAGDKIEPGQVIAEIETDKATMEVEAVDEGVIAEILVPEGSQGVKVNTPIATLQGDGAAAKPAPKQEAKAEAAAPERSASSKRSGARLQTRAALRKRFPPRRANAFLRRPSRAAWPSRAASISPASGAPAPTAAS